MADDAMSSIAGWIPVAGGVVIGGALIKGMAGLIPRRRVRRRRKR